MYILEIDIIIFVADRVHYFLQIPNVYANPCVTYRGGGYESGILFSERGDP